MDWTHGGDFEDFDELARRRRGFLLRCASRTARRFITESDDEYAIALTALYEAWKGYSRDKGPFDAFAKVVIRRRLIDYFESQKRRLSEIPVGGALDMDADGTEDGAADACLRTAQKAIAQKSAQAPASAREEIEALGDVLKGYGFGFFDLADDSPRAEKTRMACAAAVRWLLSHPDQLGDMRKRGALPIKNVSQGSGVSRKLIERHRKYIIAAAEILTGEYPLLSEYLRYIRKEGSR